MLKKILAAYAIAAFITATAADARQISGTTYVRDADTIVVAGTPVRLNGHCQKKTG
jgi:micrococcal nuclease